MRHSLPHCLKNEALIHTHACTYLHGTSGGSGKSQGSNSPTTSLSPHSHPPSALQGKGMDSSHFKIFCALCHHSSAPLLPSIHLRASGTAGCQHLPITVQQRASIHPACGALSHHSPQEKFPSLLVNLVKPY